MNIKHRSLGFRMLAVFAILASTFWTFMPAVLAAETNLIYNPSLEVADINDPSLPDQWFIGGYGDNDRVLSYPVGGHTGLVAAQIQINTYVDGDAKWYFADVPVSPDTEYYFEDYYISDVPSNVFVRYQDSVGNFSYQHLVSVLAALDWNKAMASFSPPDGTVSATVFHSLSQVGTLTVDDFAIFVQAPPTITDFVPNNSMEETLVSNPDIPLAWHQAGYGDNNAVFEYSDDAYDGDRSLKLTVSDYVDGDAKWMYSAQEMEPGDYHFSARYKTNTIPRVVAQFTRSDSSVYYFGMPNPQPQGEAWQEYSSEFSVPSDAVKTRVFFFLSENGWLNVDDFHITPYTYQGFEHPIISLTFDDGAEENITSALPVLNSYGFKTTQCYMSGAVEGFPDNILNVQAFADSGHEICSHTVTHPFLTQLTPEQVDYEIGHSQEFLQSIIDQPISSFAAPFGDYNEAVNNQIMGYYRIHRTVDEGFNSADNLDLYRLRAQNMNPSTTLAQFQSWVNKAIADNTWLILVYHRVGTENLEEYDTFKADFDAQMAWLDSTGVEVKTLDDAANDVMSQITPIPALPVADPDSGEYSSAISLSSQDSTFINYTLDGSDPSCVSGALYQDPISLSSDTTIKAIGCNDWHNSDVAEFTYTFPAVDTIPPEISLLGDDTIDLIVGQAYVEPGANAIDDVDGDISGNIVITGSVDTNTVGTYYIYYNVSDNAGNPAAEVTRTVNVKKPTPIIDHPVPSIASGGGGGFNPFYSGNTNTTPPSIGQIPAAVLGEKYVDVVEYEKSLLEETDEALVARLAGYILLQVETDGQAWYLDPISWQRYYLADGDQAYQALRKFGLGITDYDLARIPVGYDTRANMKDSDGDGLPNLMEEALGTDIGNADTDGDGVSDGDEVLKNKSNPLGSGDQIISSSLVDRLKGRILIQVEANGEAWYVNPQDSKRYYMGDGEAAYQIMRFLSVGISNKDIVHIPIGDF